MIKTVAIVDDDQDDIDILVDAMGDEFSAVKHKSFLCPVAALEAFSQKDTLIPDYIFVDVNMPKKMGDELVREIRQLPKFKDAVIIAMSTGMSRDLKKIMLRSGANFAFKKPSRFKGYSKIFEKTFHSSIIP